MSKAILSLNFLRAEAQVDFQVTTLPWDWQSRYMCRHTHRMDQHQGDNQWSLYVTICFLCLVPPGGQGPSFSFAPPLWPSALLSSACRSQMFGTIATKNKWDVQLQQTIFSFFPLGDVYFSKQNLNWSNSLFCSAAVLLKVDLSSIEKLKPE